MKEIRNDESLKEHNKNIVRNVLSRMYEVEDELKGRAWDLLRAELSDLVGEGEGEGEVQDDGEVQEEYVNEPAPIPEMPERKREVAREVRPVKNVMPLPKVRDRGGVERVPPKKIARSVEELDEEYESLIG